MIFDVRGTYDQPLEIDVHDGEVVISGPAAALALTAEAATLTAERLRLAAQLAADQAASP